MENPSLERRVFGESFDETLGNFVGLFKEGGIHVNSL
jgi:hypothetical protein